MSPVQLCLPKSAEKLKQQTGVLTLTNDNLKVSVNHFVADQSTNHIMKIA